ncbi:AAA family ATPase [Aurantiacibacter odishensis]|uniref:AAA family ATPase n=1 Tax=Aurantiacibacter odishensis TaxID=1155476 RepID=UPI0013C4584F|nr:AAA family ATPase [Aurantiacibacter odishensis]
MRIPAKVSVVASDSALEVLRPDFHSRTSDQLQIFEMEPGAKIPEEIIQDAQVMVVEVDPAVASSMDRIKQIRGLRPNLPLVVGLRDAGVSTVRVLLRQGVEDIASVPFQLEEMLDSIANAVEDSYSEVEAETELAPLIAVVKSRGGEGATTVTTHLGKHLLEWGQSGRGVCILDLDIQAGSVAPYLGVTPRRSLDDLLEAGHRLDSSVLRSVAMRRDDGIHVIAAPFDIQPLETVDSDQLLRVIKLARQEFDFVLIDLPANWTNWNLSTLLEASQILMVVELEISSLRQAKRWLELFNSVGVNASKVAVAVNRVEKKLFGSISLRDVREALKRDVLVGLPNEGSKILTAQDQGMLCSEIQGKNKFDAEVSKLTEMLVDRISREHGA